MGTPVVLSANAPGPPGGYSVPLPVLSPEYHSGAASFKDDTFDLCNGKFFFEGADYSWEQVLTICCGLSVLHVFSGARRSNDFGDACEQLGATVCGVDTRLDLPDMDLLDEAIFQLYLKALTSGRYHAVFGQVPNSTFSGGDNGKGGCQRRLRGIGPRDIYGLSSLDVADKEKVRIATILALRCESLAPLCNELSLPWLSCIPMPLVNEPSVLLLPEWRNLYDAPTTSKTTVEQCEVGAVAGKLTTVWGTTHVDDLPITCSRPTLNRELAFRLLMKAGLRRATLSSPAHMVRSGYWSNSLVRASSVPTGSVPGKVAKRFGLSVTRVNYARPSAVVPDTLPHIGDLRNISNSVAKIPGHLVVGHMVRKILGGFLDDNPAVQGKCLASIGQQITSQYQVIADDMLFALRLKLAGAFEDQGAASEKNSHLPCSSKHISTSVCGLLLHAWAVAAGDPASSIALWFRDGATAGIRVPLDQLDGIMPRVSREEIHADPADLCTDLSLIMTPSLTMVLWRTIRRYCVLSTTLS